MCLTGGACSYASSTINLSVLCYVPHHLPVSELMSGVIRPAIGRQLDALRQKLAEAGKVETWTAFQVNNPPHISASCT